MEALILCGGFARRLEPIGEFIPKALLTLNGVPLLEYILKGLEKRKDISRIVISTNKKFANQFEYWLKLRQEAGLRKRVTLVIEPSTSNENKFGAVRGIAYDIKKARINNDLLIIAGDNFYTFNISELVKRMKKKDAPSIVAFDIKSKTSLVSTGIYFIPKSRLQRFGEYIKQANNADDIGNFVSWLKDKEQVDAVGSRSGEWFDIGTIDGYRKIFMKHNNHKG